MFKRKLLALEHPHPNAVKLEDEKTIRALVLWLENTKIRHYVIEDREGLREWNSPSWNEHYMKYLRDVECPFVESNYAEQLEWLTGYAVDLEYSDNERKYQNATAENFIKNQSNAPKIVSSSSLDALDFDCEDFKNGVRSLAAILNIKNHPNHLIILQAISKLVCERLNPDAIKNPNSVIPQGKPFPFEDTNSGLETTDKDLEAASKILKLLFIQDMRNLQTKINECIVAAQKVTADPKTDTKLGKVGF